MPSSPLVRFGVNQPWSIWSFNLISHCMIIYFHMVNLKSSYLQYMFQVPPCAADSQYICSLLALFIMITGSLYTMQLFLYMQGLGLLLVCLWLQCAICSCFLLRLKMSELRASMLIAFNYDAGILSYSITKKAYLCHVHTDYMEGWVCMWDNLWWKWVSISKGQVILRILHFI